MSTYVRYSIDLVPPWLQGTVGTQWLTGFNTSLDDMLEETKDAVKTRFPTVAAANGDDTALGRIGEDRRIRRFPGETDAQYGAREQAAFSKHRRSGVEASIVEDLVGLGFGNITVMEYKDWPADLGNPQAHHSPGVIYENGGVWGSAVWGADVWGSPWWSRFWIFVGTYNGAVIPAAGAWGAAVWGVDPWGFDLAAGPVASAIAVIRQWKPAHALFCYLALLTGGTPIGSVWGYGSWGAATWGAVGTGPGVSIIEVNK